MRGEQEKNGKRRGRRAEEGQKGIVKKKEQERTATRRVEWKKKASFFLWKKANEKNPAATIFSFQQKIKKTKQGVSMIFYFKLF